MCWLEVVCVENTPESSSCPNPRLVLKGGVLAAVMLLGTSCVFLVKACPEHYWGSQSSTSPPASHPAVAANASGTASPTGWGVPGGFRSTAHP